MMTSLIIMRQLGGEGEKHKTSMIKRTDKMAPKSQGAHNTHDWWSERDNSQKISVRKGQEREREQPRIFSSHSSTSVVEHSL